MKDLTKTMEISTREMEEQEEAVKVENAASTATPAAQTQETGTATVKPSTVSEAKEAEAAMEPGIHTATEAAAPPPYVETAPEAGASHTQPTPSPSGTSTLRPGRQIPMRPAIMDRSEEEARLDAAGVTEDEKKLREKQKKGGLTKEQREELAAYELERKRIRDERVQTLAKKLIDRISVWTETDKGADVTAAFTEKTRLEIENLKMESFGLEIMHAIGQTYLSKATSFIKSQKFLGISGFFSRVKDKGTIVKETWNTMSAAIDAQLTMEEMAKMEEKGGEDWTDEKKAEYEKRVTGKILAAAWRGSKFEIQYVLRDVCDQVLNDKKVKLEKRVERAQALVIVGEMFQKASVVTKMNFDLTITNTRYRRSATVKKKVTSWPSNSSWPKPRQRKRISMTRSIKRRKKRIRRRHESSDPSQIFIRYKKIGYTPFEMNVGGLDTSNVVAKTNI
jgi:hypothetical protein